MADSPESEVWTREEAIGNLRRRLIALAEEEHSMCATAAKNGIFCRGFRRWNDAEFHERWKGIVGESTHLSRAQIERLADLWQLSEQIRHDVRLVCDAQTLAHGACRGWDEFDDKTLARFCSELLGRNVRVETEGADANASGATPRVHEIRKPEKKVWRVRHSDRRTPVGFHKEVAP